MRPILTLAAGSAVTLAITAALAWAHDTTAYHGNDYARVWNGHTLITACNVENDGNRVYGQWRNVTRQTYSTPWATQGTCQQSNIGSGTVDFRVCEEGVGCSAWKYK